MVHVSQICIGCAQADTCIPPTLKEPEVLSSKSHYSYYIFTEQEVSSLNHPGKNTYLVSLNFAPGRLKGPDSSDNTMTGDDKQEAELEGATTDDAMSLSSPSPK